MYAVVETQPEERASKMMDESTLDKPVPPYSGLAQIAPKPRLAACRIVSTGKISFTEKSHVGLGPIYSKQITYPLVPLLHMGAHLLVCKILCHFLVHLLVFV